MSIYSSVLVGSLLILSWDSFAFAGATARNPLDCSTRNSQTKYHNELVHNVAIRGEDEREFVVGKSATMPLICKSDDNKNLNKGSINLVEGKLAVTVLHNLVDLSTCEPYYNLKKCSIYDGDMGYELKWEKDPAEICKSQNGKDMAIEASLKIAPKRKGYKVLCKGQLGDLSNVDVEVKGAKADNFSKLSRKDYGKAVIVGKGKIYRVSPYENMVRYDSDSGKGTSGGAATIMKDGQEYLIGAHRGDRNTMSYSHRDTEEGDSLDGLPADENENYGEAMIFPDDMKICGDKNAGRKPK